MKIVFDEIKATQLAAQLLVLSGGKMNYMKLIKLMYLVDRAAILRWGRPVTFDRYFSLRYGPILSNTLDLVSEGVPPNVDSYWLKYISIPENYKVKLEQDCPKGKLNQAEEELIKEVYAQKGHLSEWELVDELHQLPEWQAPNGSSLPITYQDIMKAAHLSAEVMKELEEELAEAAAIRVMQHER
jgi:uncharacterized phage-associated protein